MIEESEFKQPTELEGFLAEDKPRGRLLWQASGGKDVRVTA